MVQNNNSKKKIKRKLFAKKAVRIYKNIYSTKKSWRETKNL